MKLPGAVLWRCLSGGSGSVSSRALMQCRKPTPGQAQTLMSHLEHSRTVQRYQRMRKDRSWSLDLQSWHSAESSTDTFGKFLRLPAFRHEFDDNQIVKRFVRGIRDGILHEAETRRWVIWRDEPEGRILEHRGGGYAVNRTEFYKALKVEFEGCLQELRDPQNQKRRQRFLKKMDDIVREI